MFNIDVVFAWSQALAGRVIREAGNDNLAQIDMLHQILFVPNPDKVEKATLTTFLTNPIRAAALVDLVHTVANSNEFSFYRAPVF